MRFMQKTEKERINEFFFFFSLKKKKKKCISLLICNISRPVCFSYFLSWFVLQLRQYLNNINRIYFDKYLRHKQQQYQNFIISIFIQSNIYMKNIYFFIILNNIYCPELYYNNCKLNC